MAIKYTVCVILIISLFIFRQNFVGEKMKGGQSQAQQHIQGVFKKKQCQRQVDTVQCRSEPIHQAGPSWFAN